MAAEDVLTEVPMRCALKLLLIGLLIAQWAGAQAQGIRDDPSQSQHEPIIVFVCEHGAAKSIVAASYFNKLARERNLSIQAVARGTEPQDALAPSAEKGLRQDGLTATEQKPIALTRAEATRAAQVITFLPLPKEYYSVAKVEEWNDVPPTGENYGKARDAIVAHMNKLLDELETENKSCAHAPDIAHRCATNTVPKPK
jgi:arsenate reductase